MGSGSNNRRSKSENPLQRKLSVAQHLSLTTRPQVRLHHPTLNFQKNRPLTLFLWVIFKIKGTSLTNDYFFFAGETSKWKRKGFPFAAAASDAGEDENPPEKWRRRLLR